MTALPRILTIMGSGETTPTMARVHRLVLDRLGERPVPAVVLDTPYGFQENADDITDRAVDYFRATVGAPFGIASFRSADADALTPVLEFQDGLFMRLYGRGACDHRSRLVLRR